MKIAKRALLAWCVFIAIACASLFSAPSARADAGIYQSFIIFNINGGGNQYYYTSGSPGGTAFNGLSLGTFNATGSNNSLILNGGENDVFQYNGDSITNSFTEFRFYQQGTTAPSFTFDQQFFRNDLGGNNHKWDITNTNQQFISNGMNAGVYNVDTIPFANTSFGIDRTQPQTTATFNVQATDYTWSGGAGTGATGTASNWVGGVTPGQGHNLIFSSTNNSQTAISNAFTSVNALSFTSGGPFTITGTALTLGDATGLTGVTLTPGINNSSASTQNINLGITLGNNITFNAASGNLNFSSGSIDVKSNTLTVNAAANKTVTINEALSSSNAAGGVLIKSGAGTLILQGTSNNYTGSDNTQLNAGGTQISGGTLGIYASTSLGLSPNGAYNNIQFTGSGTLQDTANTITLGTTRNISIASSAIATFDNNGNAFTLQGILNGSGGAVNVVNSGSGNAVTLSGANTYTGTTTITSGTLSAGSVVVSGGASNLGNATSAVVLGGASTAGTLSYTGGIASYTRGFTVNAGGGGVTNAGTGLLTLATGGIADSGTFTLNASNANGITVTSVISGGGGVTVNSSGAGLVTFSGGSANTYTGLTTVSAGELDLNKTAGGNAIAGDASTSTNDVTVGGGASPATLKWLASNQVGDTATITIGSNGTVNLNGFSETLGSLINNGGTFMTGANGIPANFNSPTVGLVGTTHTLDFEGGTNTVNTGGSVSDTHIVVANASTVVEVQAGGVMNVQSGGTGLVFGNTNSASHGTLTLDSAATGTAGKLVLNGDVTTTVNSGASSIVTDTNNPSAPGFVDMMTGTRNFYINSGSTLTISAQLSSSSGPSSGAINKASSVSPSNDGLGTLILTGNNSFGGGTTVTAGTVNGAANGAFGTGSLTANSGGTLMISNSSATDRINNSASVILNGGTFARSGSGTVSEGTATSTSNGGVSHTATLSTVGMGALTLQAASTLDFGSNAGGIGTLVFSSFSDATNAVLNIINYTNSHASFPTTSGIDGSDDRLVFNQNEALNLADFSFNGLAAGQIVLGDGFFEIVPIPEPSTWIGGALALSGLLLAQRRRLKRLIIGS